jgi:hypothetical protein
MAKVYDESSHVTAEEGVVYVDGPDGVSVAVTPEAALDISDELLAKATEAQGQKVQAEQGAREKQGRDEARRPNS